MANRRRTFFDMDKDEWIANYCPSPITQRIWIAVFLFLVGTITYNIWNP